MPHSKSAPPSSVFPLTLTAHLHDCLIRLKLTGFQVRARILTYADQFPSDDEQAWTQPLESNPAFQRLCLPDLPTIVCLAAPPTSLLDTVNLNGLPNPDDMNQRIL